MTEDTWTQRDLPVLRAVVDIYEETGHYLTRASAIEAAAELDADTVQRALRRLNTQPSFFEKVTQVSGGMIVMVGPPTGDALRVAGAWPSPEQLLDQLIVALDRAANDDEREPAERSKFEQAAALPRVIRLAGSDQCPGWRRRQAAQRVAKWVSTVQTTDPFDEDRDSVAGLTGHR